MYRIDSLAMKLIRAETNESIVMTESSGISKSTTDNDDSYGREDDNEVATSPDSNRDGIRCISMDTDSIATHSSKDINDNKTKAATSASVIIITTLIVAYEVGLIAAVAFLTPIESLFLLSAATTVLVNSIVMLLNTKHPFAFLEKLKTWAEEKQTGLNPLVSKMVSSGKVVGILLSTLIVGPLPAALIIDAMGFKRPENYLLATISGLFFCVAWVALYNGGIAVIEKLIAVFSV